METTPAPPFFTSCAACGTLYITDGKSAPCAVHMQTVQHRQTVPRGFVRYMRPLPLPEALAWAREARAIDGRAVCLILRHDTDLYLVYAAALPPSTTQPRF